MRPFYLLLFIAISALLFSCDPCKNLDCMPSKLDGTFRIVSAGTGADLLFGPNKIYDKEQLKFYSIKGTDTTYFEPRTIKTEGTAYDSILVVRFSTQPEVAYLQLSNSDVDTLQISYTSTSSKCCGTISEIVNYRYNNATDIPGNKGTQEIKK